MTTLSGYQNRYDRYINEYDSKYIGKNPYSYNFGRADEDTVKSLATGYRKLDAKRRETELPESRSTLDRVIDGLMLVNYASAGFADGLIDGSGEGTRSPLQGMWEGIKAGNPFGKGFTQGETTYSDVLDTAGWKPESTLGKFARGTVGFIGDVLLSPDTYLTGGASAIIKGTGRVGKGADDLIKLADDLAKSDKDALVAELVAKKVNPDLAERYAQKQLDKGKFAVDTSDGMTKEMAEKVIRRRIAQKEVVEQSDDQIAVMSQKLADEYNRLVGIRDVDAKVTWGIGNMPFAPKKWEKYNISLGSGKWLREIGDKIGIAEGYSHLRHAVYGSKIGKMFSTTSPLYKLAQDNPVKLYEALEFVEITRGLKLEKQMADKVVQQRFKDLDMTPAEMAEVRKLLQNKKIWKQVADFVKISQTSKGKQVREVFVSAIQRNQKLLDEMTNKKADLEKLIKENEELSSVNVEKIGELEMAHKEKLAEINATQIDDMGQLRKVVEAYSKEIEEVEKRIQSLATPEGQLDHLYEAYKAEKELRDAHKMEGRQWGDKTNKHEDVEAVKKSGEVVDPETAKPKRKQYHDSQLNKELQSVLKKNTTLIKRMEEWAKKKEIAEADIAKLDSEVLRLEALIDDLQSGRIKQEKVTGKVDTEALEKQLEEVEGKIYTAKIMQKTFTDKLVKRRKSGELPKDEEAKLKNVITKNAKEEQRLRAIETDIKKKLENPHTKEVDIKEEIKLARREIRKTQTKKKNLLKRIEEINERLYPSKTSDSGEVVQGRYILDELKEERHMIMKQIDENTKQRKAPKEVGDTSDSVNKLSKMLNNTVHEEKLKHIDNAPSAKALMELREALSYHVYGHGGAFITMNDNNIKKLMRKIKEDKLNPEQLAKYIQDNPVIFEPHMQDVYQHVAELLGYKRWNEDGFRWKLLAMLGKSRNDLKDVSTNKIYDAVRKKFIEGKIVARKDRDEFLRLLNLKHKRDILVQKFGSMGREKFMKYMTDIEAEKLRKHFGTDADGNIIVKREDFHTEDVHIGNADETFIDERKFVKDKKTGELIPNKNYGREFIKNFKMMEHLDAKKLADREIPHTELAKFTSEDKAMVFDDLIRRGIFKDNEVIEKAFSEQSRFYKYINDLVEEIEILATKKMKMNYSDLNEGQKTFIFNLAQKSVQQGKHSADGTVSKLINQRMAIDAIEEQRKAVQKEITLGTEIRYMVDGQVWRGIVDDIDYEKITRQEKVVKQDTRKTLEIKSADETKDHKRVPLDKVKDKKRIIDLKRNDLIEVENPNYNKAYEEVTEVVERTNNIVYKVKNPNTGEINEHIVRPSQVTKVKSNSKDVSPQELLLKSNVYQADKARKAELLEELQKTKDEIYTYQGKVKEKKDELVAFYDKSMKEYQENVTKHNELSRQYREELEKMDVSDDMVDFLPSIEKLQKNIEEMEEALTTDEALESWMRLHNNADLALLKDPERYSRWLNLKHPSEMNGAGGGAYWVKDSTTGKYVPKIDIVEGKVERREVFGVLRFFKKELQEKYGWTNEDIAKIFDDEKRLKQFILEHELDHIFKKDFFKGGRTKGDYNDPKTRQIEARANNNALEMLRKFDVDRLLDEAQPADAGKLWLDKMASSEEVANTVRKFRQLFDDMGEKEVAINKLGKEQFEQMVGRYLPRIPTEHGEAFFRRNAEEVDYENTTVTQDFGYGVKINPHAKSRTFKGTLEEANEYFREKLQGHNIFSENLADIYVARALKHNELMYDHKYMQQMLDVFGKTIDDGVLEPGYKAVMNWGNMREITTNMARMQVSMHISKSVANFIRMNKSEIGTSEAQIEKAITKYLKENFSDDTVKELYEDFHKSSLSSTGLPSELLEKKGVPMVELKGAQLESIEAGYKAVEDSFKEHMFGRLLSTLGRERNDYADGILHGLQRDYQQVQRKLAQAIATENFDAVKAYEETIESIAEAMLQRVRSGEVKMIDKNGNTKVGVSKRIEEIIARFDDLDTFMKPQLRQVHETIVNKANQARKLQMAKDESRLLQLYDKFLHFMKLNQTVILPAFHMRNFYSNKFLNWLGVGRDAFDKDMTIATQILARVKGDVDKLDEIVEKSKWGHKQLSKPIVIDEPHPELVEAVGMNNGVLHWRDIYDLAKRYDVIDDGQFARDLGAGASSKGLFPEAKKTREDGSTISFDPTDTENFVGYKAGTAVGTVVENSDRLLHFITMLKRGKSIEEAMQSSKKFLFDYSDLTYFEQHVMKRIFPYYTWLRKNARLQVGELIEQPEKYRTIAKLTSAVEHSSNEEDRMNPAFVSPWATDWMQMPWNATPKEGQEEKVIFNPAMPHMDLNRIPNPLKPWESAKNLFSQMSPQLKVPAELMMNRNVFLESDIVEKDENPIAEGAMHMLGQLGGVNAVRGFAKDNPTDIALHALNQATGVKFSTYDYEGQKHRMMDELRDTPNGKTSAISRLLGSGEETDGANAHLPTSAEEIYDMDEAKAEEIKQALNDGTFWTEWSKEEQRKYAIFVKQYLGMFNDAVEPFPDFPK